MQSPFEGFPHETVKFLRQLKRNNNRAWFQEHKAIYEEKVRQPMIELVTALGGAMQGFAPEMVTDPKRSIFRIYRDVRFSSDKSPYKTHIAAHFTPGGIGKDAGAGLYFHLSTGEFLAGGGVYMPSSRELRLIRNYISSHPEELREILRARNFRRIYGGLQGEQLVRAPKDFPPDHPALDLLRYKQFVAWFERPPAVAETHALFPLLIESFVALMPLVRYINAALRASSPVPD